MNKTTTMIFLTMVVIGLGLNAHAFFKLKAYRVEETKVAKLQVDIQSRIDGYQLVRRAANECRRQNDELEAAVHQLIDSFYRNDLPLPDDTFTSGYELGFFSAFGPGNYHIHVWIPAGKSMQVFVNYRYQGLGFGPEFERVIPPLTFDQPGWHSITCRVDESETDYALILETDEQEIMKVSLDSAVYSRSAELAAGQFGSIWPDLPQNPGRKFGTITWKVGTQVDGGMVVYDLFEIEPRASR